MISSSSFEYVWFNHIEYEFIALKTMFFDSKNEEEKDEAKVNCAQYNMLNVNYFR